MEELKLLIEMVANLPALAVWVLVGYLAYKVAIVGSIYGVIRLGIVKFHDYLTAPVVTEHKLIGKTIDEATNMALQGQLARCFSSSTSYIHMSDVLKLKQALDMIEKGEVK